MSHTETLTWRPASEKPDSDTTVLIWLADGEYTTGWWDDAEREWRGCGDGWFLCGVTHWAQPEGPR